MAGAQTPRRDTSGSTVEVLGLIGATGYELGKFGSKGGLALGCSPREGDLAALTLARRHRQPKRGSIRQCRIEPRFVYR